LTPFSPVAGCIIYGSDQEVAGLMKAVRRCNATGAFSWIGSDGWSARGLVSDGNEAEVEGTLSVQPQANPVEGFEEYFLNLTVENNKRNPWFVGESLSPAILFHSYAFRSIGRSLRPSFAISLTPFTTYPVACHTSPDLGGLILLLLPPPPVRIYYQSRFHVRARRY
jgi:hypothetical protein